MKNKMKKVPATKKLHFHVIILSIHFMVFISTHLIFSCGSKFTLLNMTLHRSQSIKKKNINVICTEIKKRKTTTT